MISFSQFVQAHDDIPFDLSQWYGVDVYKAGEWVGKFVAIDQKEDGIYLSIEKSDANLFNVFWKNVKFDVDSKTIIL